jgi:dipeptidyl aminopeptidase/acylaminoacyl peptidase
MPHRQGWSGPMTWVLVAVAVLASYQAVVLVVMVVAWRNTRTPARRTPADLGFDFTQVRFPTDNGRTLHGWWIPGGNGRRPAVILIHGWSRSAERMLPYLEMLHPAGYHLLAFDARNHGDSDRDGHASMKKFSEDIRAAVAYLSARSDVDTASIAVLGLSIGGSAAIHAAAHEPRIRAVVTVGSFAHPRDAMLQMGLGSVLLAPAMPLTFRFIEWRVGVRLDELAPERHISRVAASLLLIHGQNDSIVPIENLDRLLRASDGKAEAWRIAGRGHSDPHLEPGFAEHLRAFLATALAPAA